MAIAVKISNVGPRELVPEGIQNVVLAGIVDLGLVFSPAYGKSSPKLQFIFATELKDSQGRPQYLFKRYTNSLHEKSQLFKDFRRLAGRPLSAQEQADGIADIEKLLVGRTYEVEVIHTDNNGKTYANIDSYRASTKKVPVPVDFNELKNKLQTKAAQKQNAAPSKPATPAPISDDDIPF